MRLGRGFGKGGRKYAHTHSENVYLSYLPFTLRHIVVSGDASTLIFVLVCVCVFPPPSTVIKESHFKSIKESAFLDI